MNKEQWIRDYQAKKRNPEAVWNLLEEVRILSNTLDSIMQFIGKQVEQTSFKDEAGANTMKVYIDLLAAIQSIEQVCRNSKQS